MSRNSVFTLNKFLLFKLPSAYFSGVRVKSISDNEAIATVKHQWINQNPFKSLYWATQGMASELSTGILLMKQIAESGKSISILVTNQKGTFTKKATGRINFSCKDGKLIKDAIERTLATGEGQTITMSSEGIDEQGDCVSKFEYEWSIKAR
jgi:hypothetical protein